MHEWHLFAVHAARQLDPRVPLPERGPNVEEQLFAEHESEHAELGRSLTVLRTLCDDYNRDAALCNTHRALLDALEAFEQDLHRHVHEENNILLPRARNAGPAYRRGLSA